jgi:prepilin-type N-terminal cleavage/methylation domain-containing protein
MKKYLHPNKSKGFTLIELLIVIAIIGILAAVLIAVINPVAQMNKARDAVIKSTIEKIGLAVNSYHSAYGVFPTCSQLSGEFNTDTVGAITGTDPECVIAAGNGTAAQAGKYNSVTTDPVAATDGALSFPALGTGTTGQFWYWTPTGSSITVGTTEAW